MKSIKLCVLLVSVVLIGGCASSIPSAHRMAMYQDENVPTLETSLFKSDQQNLSEADIAKILESKIQLPQNAKIAMMKYPDRKESGRVSRYYGRYYWRSEEYLNLQQAYSDTLAAKLLTAQRVADVTGLPSLLTPRQADIPTLREAAVRLQADMLLIFRVSSDVYQKYRVFRKDEAKAFSTCEVVLLDIRTGIIPFTSVVTREFFTQKLDTDFNNDEMMKRAEQNAVLASLNEIADQMVAFFDAVP